VLSITAPQLRQARSRAEADVEQARVMKEAIDILKRQGAVIVDPADIPSSLS
jgi:hypothetical protein